MSEEQVEITDEQFQLFCSEVKKWLRVLGLLDWKIYFQHGDVEGENSLAELSHETWPFCERSATLFLAKEAPQISATNENIKRCAFHEACELLLARFWGMACSRWAVDPHVMEEERHTVIRRLESAFVNTIGE